MTNALYLIDGTAFAYRSFHAIRELSNSRGQPTNAVFGFTRVMLRLLREEDPSHVAIVFDAPGKTFREALYADYKATRAKQPEELTSQLPYIHRVVEALNLPEVMIEGVEADDVLGSLARKAQAAGMPVVIVTGDKDMLQMVGDGISVYDPYKAGGEGKRYGPEDVEARYGVPPERVIDAFALIGDTSDNVPGVRGIGEKTAGKLLQQFGSLDTLLASTDQLKGKQRERLEEGRDEALLSRELVTIKTDVDCGVEDLDAFARRDMKRDALAELFRELEFGSLQEEFLPDGSPQETLDYRLIRTREDLEAAIAEMRAAGEFAVDTETTSTHPMEARLVGVSMSCRESTGYYVAIAHSADAMAGDLCETADAAPPLDGAEALGLLRPLLEDPAVGKVGHNLKYDLIVLARAGIALRGITLDTMVASYLTDPSRLRHNLSDVSLHYLNRKMIPIADLIGSGAKAVTFDTVPVARACDYASEDADIAWRLAQVLRPLLRERGLERLYEDLEQPLIGVLARMEQAGVAIDVELFERLRREVEERLAALESEIHDLAGEPFQVNSPKQLQRILFDVLGLKPIRKTKTGYSTDVEVLQQLAAQTENPLPGRILEYRMLEKLRGTYIEALPRLVNPETGRLHTSFNQSVAATGRLSSSDPNLQNIPVRTEMGRRIRRGFVPGRPDWQLISADYSQIELRVLAHLSEDEALCEAFERGADIHRETAARIFEVAPDAVTPEMRRQAKAVNFGVVYGISPFGLSRNLGIAQGEAARFIDQYFTRFPGVRRWVDTTLERARQEGFVTTLMGRRRYVSELNSRNGAVRRQAERIAVNTPVQGTAADIIKVAMLRIDAAFEGAPVRQLLQVHDELLLEAPEAEAADAAAQVAQMMAGAASLRVPLQVDVGVGRNWEEIH
jgi:DNA polymerase-1